MIDPKEGLAYVVNQTIKWVALGMLIALVIGGMAGFLISWWLK
jgi:high-affinity Fe2+/Pb2+ permease